MPQFNPKPIFDVVRPWVVGGYTPQQIAQLDAAIAEAMGQEKPPAALIAENPKAYALSDEAAFWARIRPIFGGSISEAQLAGIKAILLAARHQPVSWVSYELATAFHETGGKISPNRENMNYSVAGLRGQFGRHRISDADCRKYGRAKGQAADQQAIANIVYGGEFGRDQLGNVKPGDGWKYRGGGMCHNTGRTNAERADHDLGLGGAYLSNPDVVLDIDIAAREMVTGMESGRYSGKNLARYLRNDRESHASFMAARPIINGTDRADDVADHAINFQSGLIAGKWG